MCVCVRTILVLSHFFFFGWAMLYGLNGLESRQKILMGINSLFFFLVGPQFGPLLGPKYGWAKRGPRGLAGRVWALQKKIRLIIRLGLSRESEPTGRVRV